MKRIFLLFVFIIIVGCSANHFKSKRECSKAFDNDFKSITVKKYSSILKSDTITFNEIHFVCSSPILSKEIMFNNFGKWDLAINPEGVYHPILVWKSVDLFGEKNLYNIYTRGVEAHGSYSTSFMVFDQEDNDLINGSILENDRFIEYFSKLIKENKSDNKNFEREYLKILQPRKYKIVF